MAKQVINLGAIANDGTGDPLRVAFTKINANFTELYTGIEQQLDGVQADWTQTDSLSLSFIKNKPTIPADVSDLTDNENLLGGGGSYNQSLNTTDDVTFDTVTVTNVSGIENADGQRITNTYYDGTLLVGSNFTQTPVSILMGGAGPRNEWKFTPDSNLTLPAGGDILNSDGVSVLFSGDYADLTNKPTIPDIADFTFNGNTLSTDAGMSLSTNSGSLDINVGNKTYSFVNNTQFGFSYLEIPGSIQAGLQTGFLSSNGLGIAIDGYNSPNTVDIGNISSSTVLRLKDGDGAGNVIVQSLGSSLKVQTGNSSTWEFNDNGKLSLPEGGDIVDSSGNSVLGGSGGSTDRLVNGSKTIVLGAEGKLTLPAGITYEYLSVPLTGHGDGLAVLDFALVTDGVQAQWIAATPNPQGVGYSVGDTFTFDEEFLGIPGASTTIEVLSIGSGGSIVELGFSQPPLYPADIYRDSPINLQVGAESNRWTFGASGNLTLPAGGDIVRWNGSELVSVLGGTGGPTQPYLELTNVAFINPVSFTKSDYGNEVDVIVEDAEADTLRQTYLEAEAMWVDARDQDAQLIAPETRPWDGMSSIDAYPVLANAGVQTPPAPSNFPPLLQSANNAYLAWQESLATSTGIAITRGVQQGVYNPYRDNSWDSDVSPTGTLWNVNGWDDLTDVESREYLSFMDAYNGNLGNNVPGSSAIMYVPSTDLYYAVQWLSWTQNNAGGGFSYIRSEIDLTQLNEGITFADGTVQKTAYSRVKSTASNDRRIEEVSGSSEVSVTAVSYGATQDATILNTSDSWDFYVDATEDLNTLYNNISSFRYLEFSFDGETTWIPVTIGGGTPGVSYQMVFEDDISRPVVQGRVVRYRVVTGGDPVIWWDKAALPGGSNDFRGAIIDYHAFTEDATWIGTIHIADDDGDDTITHTEVSSGSTDSMNNDLWYVTSEGGIQYRRFDGESKTLKVHWIAKVFYGSEIYD